MPEFPTKGRIVMFTDPLPTEPVRGGGFTHPTWPLIVVEVFDDGVISGWLFSPPPNDGRYERFVRPAGGDGKVADEPGRWHWPVRR
jgi:hypothetical protein